MVYRTKCGTVNADDAEVCFQCRASLSLCGAKAEGGPYWKHGRMRYEEDYRYVRRRGALATLILGLIVISIGFLYPVSAFYGVSIPWSQSS
jgi:hypothetical protein